MELLIQLEHFTDLTCGSGLWSITDKRLIFLLSETIAITDVV